MGRTENEAGGINRALGGTARQASEKRREQTATTHNSRETEMAEGHAFISESELCGVIDGIPSKLDASRIKGLGNAIVPQVASEILKTLVMGNNKVSDAPDSAALNRR
jgi:hypothetical protein